MTQTDSIDTRGPDAPRVVSLIASATEILHELGGGHLHVGRSHECDFPQSVMDLPQLTRAKFKVDASSRDVDTAVKSLIEQGLAVYEVYADDLRSLSPDVILTQDQCEVCAVSLADVERAVATWTSCSANVVSLRPHTLDDIYSDNQRIADAIGRPEAGVALNARMQQRFAEIAKASASDRAPRIAYIEWIDPPMSGGHWMPELIEIAGGTDLLGVRGQNSPWITVEQVAAADPDVILIGPCGYDLDKVRAEMAVLDNNPAWQSLRAVKEGRQFIADGNAYFNRPGPRLVESAEILAEVMHPDRCAYGHLGKTVLRHG